MTLDPKHIEHLRTSGLTDETIAASRMYTARDSQIAEILGWQPKDHDWGAGIVIPFFERDGSENCYKRVRLDFPRQRRASRGMIRYESPIKSENRPYFPPGIGSALDDSTSALILTEGEKKAICATQFGLPCIGLTGVWGWQERRNRDDHGRAFGSRKLLRDLEGVEWAGRQVFIAFDSDAADNRLIQQAEFRLAEALTKRGTVVRVVRIPKDGAAKVGLDDFIVKNGIEAFRDLLTLARPAEVPGDLGPMQHAREYIDEVFRDDEGRRLLAWHRDEFLWYKGGCYIPVARQEIEADVLRWMEARNPQVKPRHAAEIVTCVGAETHVPFSNERPCWITTPAGGPTDNIINFQNGLLDIAGERVLKPHTPSLLTTNQLSFPYDSSANCPAWMAFLESSLVDEDRILLLGEWLGLLLTRATHYQKILLMVGPPRSGKGTITRAMQHVFGASNVTSPSFASLSGDFGLAPLVGKAVAILADAHIVKRADAGRVLEIIKGISGEDSMDVNRKNQPHLQNVRIGCRFVISVNELPHFHDSAGAMSARLCILPFDKSFEGQEDLTLEGRIKAEGSGILNWALEGLDRLNEQGGFTVPRAAEDMKANYRRLMSPVTGFLEDACEIGPGLEAEVADVYQAYAQWAADNGHATMAKPTFGEKLRSCDPGIIRARRGDSEGRGYFYRGLALTEEGALLADTWRQRKAGRSN